MTEEEKKNIVTLNSEETETGGGSETTKTVEPKQVTTTTTLADPRYSVDKDGNMVVNEQVVDDMNKRIADLARPMHINPDTNKVDDPNKYLTSLFGVSPQYLEEKRKKEMELEKFKKGESAFYNAISLLGDMASAAHGGNVWRREPNRYAATANEKIAGLENEQQQQAAAEEAAIRNAETGWAQIRNKAVDDYISNYGQKVQTVTTTGGGSHEIKTVSPKTTTKVREEQLRKKNGDGDGDGSNGGKYVMNVRTRKTPGDPNSGTDIRSYNLSRGEFEATKGVLQSYYASVLFGKDTKKSIEMKNFLNSIGVSCIRDMNGNITWKNDDELLYSGDFYKLPDDIRQQIVKKSGNKVKFVDIDNSIKTSGTSRIAKTTQPNSSRAGRIID